MLEAIFLVAPSFDVDQLEFHFYLAWPVFVTKVCQFCKPLIPTEQICSLPFFSITLKHSDAWVTCQTIAIKPYIIPIKTNSCFLRQSTDKKSFVVREWALRRALRERETGASKVKDTPAELEKTAVKDNEQEKLQDYQKEGLKHASVWKPFMWVWGWSARFLHTFDEKISSLLRAVVSKWFFN